MFHQIQDTVGYEVWCQFHTVKRDSSYKLYHNALLLLRTNTLNLLTYSDLVYRLRGDHN